MTGLLISDFNLGNLAALINNDEVSPRVTVVAAPFGHVTSVLVNGDDPLWSAGLDWAFVWTRPETAIPSFQRFTEFLEVDRAEVLDEVDAFAAALLRAAQRTKLLFVATWEIPPYHAGHGATDLSREAGVGRLLLEMNLRLLERLDGQPSVVVLHSRKWFQLAGDQAFSPRLWYLGKIPFGNPVFKHAAADLKAALRASIGGARKVLILDLDDTLWGGIVGDVGWENLRVGGHDPVGEALIDFQRQVKTLTRRGIILAIVSKNDEAVALTALSSHPEMVLRPSDFAGWRINWGDKAQNIVDLLTELNLGLDSAVFIDDNPVERARVRESLPDVLVPEWPQDKRLYPAALLSLECFSNPAITSEDRKRSTSYVIDRQRTALKLQAGSLDEWLESLDMRVVVEPLTDVSRARVGQLLNKTNQMNLSTRRLTELELFGWLQETGNVLWTFRVSDKLGDSGLTGIASVTIAEQRAHVVDFVLSCRVMGRHVEEMMMHVLTASARAHGATELVAVHRPTAKNNPCLEFLRRSGLKQTDSHRFVWALSQDYPAPAHIHIDLPCEILAGASIRPQ